jgi:putative GTP pyrophosphokinase
MALAGLLEIADREFEAIQKEDASIRANARQLITSGRLSEVELTPDALRAYLGVRLGTDDRISDWTYDWTTKMLRSLGFQNIEQVDTCLLELDDDKISRVVYGVRVGQVSRFEAMLQASMGENFLKGHPWGEEDWYQNLVKAKLGNLRRAGLTVGSFQPHTTD